MYFIFIKKLKSKAGEILFPNRQLAQEEEGERERYIYIYNGGWFKVELFPKERNT